jgi:hypothetical protein
MSTKIVDSFVWFIVTEKAKEIFSTDLFELFILHDDNSESLVESYDQINEALEKGLDIAIEVGHLKIN